MLKVEVKEVLSSVVVIHAYVFELKVYFDIVIGQKRGKLDELIPEVFNELLIDVGDPCFHLDGNVLKQKMDALFLLQY